MTKDQRAQRAREPIPMILYCPKCHEQHVDEPDERTPDWDNPPHRSHLCHACGCIWRPCDVATEGVRSIKTAGERDTWGWDGASLAAFSDAERVGEGALDMVLHCPKCGLQHVDAADEEAIAEYDPLDAGASVPWTNPPHRSHLCHGCGCIWRPADIATNGVLAVETKGSADNWQPLPASLNQPAASVVEQLRQALIECGRAAGATLADDVSTDFLLLVPDEVRGRLALSAALPSPSESWQHPHQWQSEDKRNFHCTLCGIDARAPAGNPDEFGCIDSAAPSTPVGEGVADLGKIAPGHVCKHQVRWPHPCEDCDRSAWAERPSSQAEAEARGLA